MKTMLMLTTFCLLNSTALFSGETKNFIASGSDGDFNSGLAQEDAILHANEKCHPLKAKQVSSFKIYRLPGGLAGIGASAEFTCVVDGGHL